MAEKMTMAEFAAHLQALGLCKVHAGVAANLSERSKRVTYTSLYRALMSAFRWSDTPQGYEFWAALANSSNTAIEKPAKDKTTAKETEMKKAFDWTKPLVTRDGNNARLLCKINNTNYPYAVAIEGSDGGNETVQLFTEAGKYYADGDSHHCDLGYKIEERVVYFNLYTGSDGAAVEHSTAEAALAGRSSGCHGTIQVVMRDGVAEKVSIWDNDVAQEGSDL